MGVEEILIASLSLDERFQHRDDGLNAERVEEYAADVDKLPPPVVFREGNKNWFPGGFHRLAAHEKVGLDKIRCTVRTGTWLEAYRFSLAENSEHGMRRTSADKRKAVMDAKAISIEKGLFWSDREICRLCQVGESYLKDLRLRKEKLSDSLNKDDSGSNDDALHVNVHIQEWIAEGKLTGAAKDAVLNLGGFANAAREAKQSQYVRRIKSGATHAQAMESVRKGGKREDRDLGEEEEKGLKEQLAESLGTITEIFDALGRLDEAKPPIDQLAAMI
jgi:ParB-like chromosome segregation protein Spo0J